MNNSIYFYRFVFWQQQRRMFYPFDWTCLRFLFHSIVKLAKQNYPPNSVNVEKLENTEKNERGEKRKEAIQWLSFIVHSFASFSIELEVA